MSERGIRFRLGIFVLLALVLLGTMIVMFGSFGAVRLFRRTATYFVTFTEAPGVAPGTPVRRSGVRIGEVADVQLDDESGKVKVTLGIDKRFTIRENETPTLSTSVIGGDSVIDFVPKKQDIKQPPLDRSPVPEGSTIAGETQATVGSLLTKASEVVPTTQDLMNDIRKSLQALEKMAPNVDATMKEFRDLAAETRTLVPEVKKTNAQIQDFVKSAQDVMPDVKKTAEELRKAATAFGEGAPELRETNRELQKLIKSANDAFPEVRRTNLEIQKLAASLNDAVPEARKTNQEIQKLVGSLNDMAPEVRKTNRDLQELLKQTTDVMPDVKTTVRDLGATAQQYNRLGENLDKLVRDNQAKVVRVIDNLNATLDRTLDLLSNENRRNVTDTLRNLRNASVRFPETAKNLDETMKEGPETVRQLRQTLQKLDEALTPLRDLTKPFSERGPAISRNLDESLDKLNRSMTDLRELMRVVGESDGTFRRFITDPSIYNRLDETLCMFQKVVPRVDRILKDFETFADKLARHPEAIGIGGVVRPGSGLKDPPDPYPGKVVPPGH